MFKLGLRLGLVVTVCAVLQIAVFADARMVNIDGHTMVRLRAFAHQFDALTDYDAATNTYSVSRNGTTVYLIPYSTSAWINDNAEQLRHVPVIIDGAMYAPLRFLCRAFDLNCTWAPGYSSVVIVAGGLSITWLRDDGWGARQHTWLHPSSYRFNLRNQSAPRQYFHGSPLPPSGGSHHLPSGAHVTQPGYVPPAVHIGPPGHNQLPGSFPPSGHNAPTGHGQQPGNVPPIGHIAPTGHGQQPGNVPPSGHNAPTGHGQQPGNVPSTGHIAPTDHGSQTTSPTHSHTPVVAPQPSTPRPGSATPGKDVKDTKGKPSRGDEGKTKNDNKDDKHQGH